MNAPIKLRFRMMLFTAPAMFLLLGGCLITTAPLYDDQTDKLITQLQTDADTEIVMLISLDHKIAALTTKADNAKNASDMAKNAADSAKKAAAAAPTADEAAKASDEAAKAADAAQKVSDTAQKALADAKTKASFDGNGDFYDKVDVDLIGLKTRVDAAHSSVTQQMDAAINLIRSNLLATDASLRLMHQKDGIISETNLTIIQTQVDAQIGALLTLELQIKNGATTSAGSTGSADASKNSG